MAGAMLDIVGVLMLSVLGGLAAFILVASRLMIALLIGIAPVMIFLTLFEVTKDYFARWLSALVSFALYPIVVAGVFATITGVSSALIGELGDPEGASNIGALIPFFMMVLMAKGFIIAAGLQSVSCWWCQWSRICSTQSTAVLWGPTNAATAGNGKCDTCRGQSIHRNRIANDGAAGSFGKVGEALMRFFSQWKICRA